MRCCCSFVYLGMCLSATLLFYTALANYWAVHTAAANCSFSDIRHDILIRVGQQVTKKITYIHFLPASAPISYVMHDAGKPTIEDIRRYEQLPSSFIFREVVKDNAPKGSPFTHLLLYDPESVGPHNRHASDMASNFVRINSPADYVRMPPLHICGEAFLFDKKDITHV